MYYSGNSFGTVAENIFLADDDTDGARLIFRPLNRQALGLKLGADEVSVAGPVEVQHFRPASEATASDAAQTGASLTVVEDDLFVLALFAEFVPCTGRATAEVLTCGVTVLAEGLEGGGDLFCHSVIDY